MKILVSCTLTEAERSALKEFEVQNVQNGNTLIVFRGTSCIDGPMIAIRGGKAYKKSELLKMAEAKYTEDDIIEWQAAKGKHLRRKNDVVNAIREKYSETSEKKDEFEAWARGRHFDVAKGFSPLSSLEICLAKALEEDPDLIFFNRDFWYIKALEDAGLDKNTSASDAASKTIKDIYILCKSKTGTSLYGVEVEDLDSLLFGGKVFVYHDGIYLNEIDIKKGALPAQAMPLDAVANNIYGDTILGWVPWSICRLYSATA